MQVYSHNNTIIPAIKMQNIVKASKSSFMFSVSNFLLEKEMAILSSNLAWKIPCMYGRAWQVQSMGSQRVRHNCQTSLSLSLPKPRAWKSVIVCLFHGFAFYKSYRKLYRQNNSFIFFYLVLFKSQVFLVIHPHGCFQCVLSIAEQYPSGWVNCNLCIEWPIDKHLSFLQ